MDALQWVAEDDCLSVGKQQNWDSVSPEGSYCQRAITYSRVCSTVPHGPLTGTSALRPERVLKCCHCQSSLWVNRP